MFVRTSSTRNRRDRGTWLPAGAPLFAVSDTAILLRRTLLTCPTTRAASSSRAGRGGYTGRAPVPAGVNTPHDEELLGGAGVTGVGSDEIRVGGRLNGGLL